MRTSTSLLGVDVGRAPVGEPGGQAQLQAGVAGGHAES